MEESDSSSSISLTSEQTQKILDQATNSLCLIKTENIEGYGFFCLIPYLPVQFDSQDLDNDKLQPVMITCNSILKSQDLKKGNNIKIIYKNEEKIIIIDESRNIYYNELFDITIIELRENEFHENIFLKLDDKISDFNFKKYLYYEDEEIYLIYNLNGKEPKYLIDKIGEINYLFIKNYCPNENIPLGSPILYLDTFNVIGIHLGKIGKKEKIKYNIGTILSSPIFEYNKSKINIKKRLLYNININDEPKCIFDVMSQKFIKDKNELINKLNEYLISAELTDVYRNEVITKFKSKFTKIFDNKSDTNTLLNFMSKVIGLPNIVTYIILRNEKNGDILECFAYLNGKIDLVNNVFSLEKKDSIFYGKFGKLDEDYVFQSFRPQNVKIFIKIKIDSVYVMCYREQYKILFLLKIKQKFKENPIQSVNGNFIADEDDDDNEYFYKHEKLIKNKERVDELFEKQTKIENYYLEELIIYKIDD